jgi:hypothetical protein
MVATVKICWNNEKIQLKRVKIVLIDVLQIRFWIVVNQVFHCYNNQNYEFCKSSIVFIRRILL